MRKLAVLLLVLALVGSAVAPFPSVKANPQAFNPFPIFTNIPDDVNITIRITSPNENASYSNGTINVHFNETINGPNGISTNLNVVTNYQGDWMQESRWCPFPPGVDLSEKNHFLQFNFDISGIPVGERTLNIKANGNGEFNENKTEYTFTLQKTISIKFFVSTSPVKLLVHPNPIITFPSFLNATFTNSSFPLNFTVDSPASEFTYSLDGQENVPISGNTTLSDLPNGQHKVTVYATDEFGYTGTSEALFFKVDVPNTSEPQKFSMVTVAVSVIAIVSVVAAIGALVFRRKHRKNKEQKILG